MRRLRSLAIGAGSLLDLSGRATAQALRTPTRTRRERDDWSAVGDEIRTAAGRVAPPRLAPRSKKDR